MTSSLPYVLELLELIEKQEEAIRLQDKIIIEVVNDNLEKENMINVLLTETRGG